MTEWRALIQGRFGGLDLDVELRGGEGPVALVGPNGSGKTTCLRALVGFQSSLRVELETGGKWVVGPAGAAPTPPERRRIGYVPQGYGLFPHLTAIENVAFGLRSDNRRERRRQAEEALRALDAAEVAPRLPAALSGGEQQRVALARALVAKPQMLLLDEPLAALDAAARRRVRAFLAEHLRAFAGPTIVVTHEARDIAALNAEVVVLDKGRVAQRGTLAELREEPSSDFVAELVRVD